MNSKLFQPVRVGNMTLSHRMVMAPLTRFRADADGVPLPFVAEYYAQRACVPGTLLITEATFISARAGGDMHAPGIWSPAQVASWRRVADAVHARGSRIVMQLWALGRAAKPSVLARQGLDFVSSSATPMPEHPEAPGAAPRPLTADEIAGYAADYAQAARNAVAAGFDGVELHCANGYLPDQFLQDVVNVRDDAWGGSVPARARFALEATRAVCEAVGAARVGVRLSPWSRFQNMRMEDPRPQFREVIRGLRELGIAYLHVVLARIKGNADVEASESIDFALEEWREGGNAAPFFAAGGFTPERARSAVDEQYQDSDVCVVFGRPWISNPDLAFRIKEGVELRPYNRESFYLPMREEGYTDYTVSDEFKAQAKVQVTA